MESRNWSPSSKDFGEPRKGGEYIGMEKSIKPSIKSSMLRAGKRTFFFDVKLTSNSKKYLKITESAYEGEGKMRRYNSFLLWPENIVDFQKNLTEVSNFLAQ